MTQEILPATRTWPEDVEELGNALLNGAHNSRLVEAGLYVLFRDDEKIFSRPSFRSAYIVERDDKTADLNWQMVSVDLWDLPYSTAKRAMLACACSLADEAIRINIAKTLAQLTPGDIRAVLDAFRHVCGL